MSSNRTCSRFQPSPEYLYENPPLGETCDDRIENACSYITARGWTLAKAVEKAGCTPQQVGRAFSRMNTSYAAIRAERLDTGENAVDVSNEYVPVAGRRGRKRILPEEVMENVRQEVYQSAIE